MKELTEFIKSVEFQTALFNNINTILPEYNFIQYSGKWMSPLNIDRSEPEHKKRDKTVITREVPGTMLENGEGGTLNILQYLTERDGKEIYETVVSICNTAGIKLPTSKEYDPEAYKRSQERADILDLCNGYFVYCLDTEANPVKEYLQDVRKYTPELYKKMGLGYIPGREKLFNYLKGKGYAQDDLDAVLNVKRDEAGNITGAWKVIGEVNKLTIPYIRSGALIGFNIRAVTPTDPKYKYMNTLKSGDKTPGFFNLPIVKECNDLVIVEGELDALHCKVMGINNVVAVGTNKISKEMVVEAVGAGYTSFTLCYDNDKGKDISKQIIKDIQNIQINSKYKVNRVNIASLPELDGDKVDPDRLIKEKGIDALKEVIATATPYYIYYLNKILDKYRLIREDRELNDTDVADLKAEVIKTAYNIPDPTDRDLFNNKFLNDPYVNKLGINKASLEEMEDRLRYDKDKDKLAQRLKKLLTDTEDGLKNGEAYKILDDLDKTVRDLKTAGADLPVILTYEGIIKEITDMPETYKTGYDKLDEYIGFKPGAITLIAGRPGHGKTTLMLNLLLEMSQIYKGKTFYFFSYEEPVRNIFIKVLNRIIDTDLLHTYPYTFNLKTKTNYEFIKTYIATGRNDLPELEAGKEILRDLVDSQRIRVIGKNYMVEDLYNVINYLNKKEEIGTVFIDYIQRIQCKSKYTNTQERLAYISDYVLQISKDSGLPIILGAQLNRATLEAKDKRPSLENLKASGNLEEDANTVISVYCPIKEEEDKEDWDLSDKHNSRSVNLEIKTLKNREGEVNKTSKLGWDRWTGRIKDENII